MRKKRIKRSRSDCCEFHDLRLKVRDREARAEINSAEAQDVFDYMSFDEYEDSVISAISEKLAG
jgi:hypothetical protein